MSDNEHPSHSQQPEGRARRVIFGSQHDRIMQRLRGLDPDLAAQIQDFAYDTVYDSSPLDLKTQELIACALLVSLGSPPELRTHLRGALNAGATEEEVRGALIMCVPYLGFPRAVAGFEVLKSYMDAQETKKG
ncbi:carboxymuconolactone decarboxylase family protein [Deinococcus humi]|uniref:4-carboxymuconolactone decarboxylase n=1 Tax=Deinococcus humi TaxID=662880 RepID=A0A7W8JTX7_9DEIO|nr:carboxymuconolactone decarboxylase family protein [Deinococcus humi]MBB5361721.1 4-carboxymuconolactone decarboxylase [Deinococcus humi]GGO23993.1 4-carboxymuconolactone decarboxylase [Deinococcus humi]